MRNGPLSGLQRKSAKLPAQPHQQPTPTTGIHGRQDASNRSKQPDGSDGFHAISEPVFLASYGLYVQRGVKENK